MKTGLKKEMDYINERKKSAKMAEEINEMMIKMTLQKQMEDALKKR